MIKKEIKKNSLIKKVGNNVELKTFVLKNIDLKPFIKGKKLKVFKKSKLLKQVVVAKQENKKLTIKQVFKKTKLNQNNISFVYKKNNLFENNLKSKNVYYLSKKTNGKLKSLWLLIVGAIIGFINGFWGGGGGMICVPTLTSILKLPDKKAHATAILIMLPLSVASFVVYLIHGSIKWETAGFVTGGFVIGGILGALILKKINNVVLRIIFSVVIIAGAIKLLI